MTRATHIRKVCPIFSSIKIFCKVLWKLMEAPKQTRRGTFVEDFFGCRLRFVFFLKLKGPNFVKVECKSYVVLNFYYCDFSPSTLFFFHGNQFCMACSLGECME